MSQTDLTKIGVAYCPKCGHIDDIPSDFECLHCGTKFLEINPARGLTIAKYREIMALEKYGEKTHEECIAEWNELCKPFIEEVIKKHPQFDIDAYNDLPRWKEEMKQNAIKDAEREKLIQEQYPHLLKKTSSSSSVQCPYCKSHNTKKITATSRAFSIGFFGLGSKKIGKQWHCNSCGSDF